MSALSAGCGQAGQAEPEISRRLDLLASPDAAVRAAAGDDLAAMGPRVLFQLCPFIRRRLDRGPQPQYNAVGVPDADERTWRAAYAVEERIALRWQGDEHLDDYYHSLRPVKLPRRRVDLPGDLAMEFVKIPAGTFIQGSQNPGTAIARAADMPCFYAPVRKVTISRPFWLAVDKVTQDQFEAVMGFNRSRAQFPHYPIERVTWYEALEFCRRLGQRDGRTYNLPTEAQWEYAVRAGGTSRHAFGNAPMMRLWTEDAAPATRWGLRRVHSGVFEWCLDWYEQYTPEARVDPVGPPEGFYKAVRSSYNNCSAPEVRAVHRMGFMPDIIRHGVGFRPVCEEMTNDEIRMTNQIRNDNDETPAARK